MKTITRVLQACVLAGLLGGAAQHGLAQTPPATGGLASRSTAPTDQTATNAKDTVEKAAAEKAAADKAATDKAAADKAAAEKAAAAETQKPAPNAPKQPAGTVDNRPAKICSWLPCAPSGSCCATVFVIVLLIVVAVLAIVLVRSAKAVEAQTIANLPTSFFFWLGMSYLVVLLLVGAFYVTLTNGTSPCLLGGVLPIAVPWFGALGAVMISLAGVFFHSDQGWDKKFNYWHIGRPLFGAVLGIIAFFMFILIMTSAGTTIPFLTEPAKSTPKDYIVFYVLAFLVGYREETFRDLIQRVTDLILKPAPGTDPPAITFKLGGAIKTSADFGSLQAGTPSAPLAIEIVNTGKGALHAPKVTVDSSAAGVFVVAKDNVTPGGDLKPGDSRTVEVTFTPPTQNTFNGALVISGSNLSGGAKLALTGKGQ